MGSNLDDPGAYFQGASRVLISGVGSSRSCGSCEIFVSSGNCEFSEFRQFRDFRELESWKLGVSRNFRSLNWGSLGVARHVNDVIDKIFHYITTHGA